MKKKYISPLFAELELELEDVLFDSTLDNEGGDDDFGDGDPEGGFDAEEDFAI
ncbi:MAG: hypothetical protein ACI3XA_05235 [Clostridia bacterium]